MTPAWKMFVTDTGLNSYQNEDLELRDYYRVLVFLQNCFKGRIQEKQSPKKSMLFELVKVLQRNSSQQTPRTFDSVLEELDENDKIIYLDGSAICVGWCTCGGVSITARSTGANAKVTEIANVMQKNKVWWNKGA